MQEAELQARHRERVAPTDAATRRSLTWGFIALGGMFGGVGTAALIEDRNHPAANVFGVSGLAIGVVGLIGLLLTMPSMQDSVDAEARHKLFVEGEDDMGAVNRGIDRANQTSRRGCAAQPAQP